MKTKKTLRSGIAAAAGAALCILALAGCAGAPKEYQIAVPSDTTNEARALLLLQDQGLITLNEGAGLTATVNDITDNPYNIKIIETEAANLPRALADVDMAVINGNYALSANLSASSALAGEKATSAAADEYPNVIAVRPQDRDSEKTRVLAEVLTGGEVRQFIEDTYAGAVVPIDEKAPDGPAPGDAAPAGGDKTIKVGASPAPHAEILEFAKDLVAARGYTLEIVEFSDYIQPNVALGDGSLDANYFQHVPYLEEYNKENGTDFVAAAYIHFESLCLYPGKTASLEALRG